MPEQPNNDDLLANILENQNAKMTENNQLLENLIEQNAKDKGTESLLEAQIELLNDIKSNLTVPKLEVKGEDIKIDLSKIEESISKLVEKSNEPIEVKLTII